MNENQTNASEMNERQSQLATVLIGVLIVVAGFLIYTVFSNQATLETDNDIDLADTTNNEETTNEEVLDNEVTETPEGGANYIVKAGDTLWSIAQAAYSDGYRWREIAEANNIPNNDTSLEVGQEIQIPAIGGPAEDSQDTQGDVAAEENADNTTEQEETAEPTPTETPEIMEEPSEESDTAESDSTDSLPAMYTIQHGDTLWSIAQRFYGDGNQWKVIFEYGDNNLSYYTSTTTGQQYPIIHTGNVITIPVVN